MGNKFVLLLLLASAIADNSSLLLAGSRPALAESTAVGSPVREWIPLDIPLDRYTSFYIGYARFRGEKQLITLDIRRLDSLGEAIHFSFIMNAKTRRWDGAGKILPDRGIIEFDDLFAGRICRNDAGKIIFEAPDAKSTDYWIIEER